MIKRGFQGSVQALGGLMEAGIGVGMTLSSSGHASPLGWPIMAHGLDHFFTGLSTAFSNQPRATVTNQILQKNGIAPSTSNLIDSGLV